MIKDYISQALLLLMQKKSYSQITIQEITKEAGVNRSTYYRNFNSKETIIQYVFGEIIDRFDDFQGVLRPFLCRSISPRCSIIFMSTGRLF